MITSLIDSDILDTHSESELIRRLTVIGEMIDGKQPPKKLADAMKSYLGASAKHTTHPSVRTERGKILRELIGAV